MSWVKKIVLSLFRLVAFAFLGLVVAGLVVLIHPDVVGESRLIALARWGASSSGVTLYFGSTPQLSIASTSLLGKRLRLSGNNLCVHVAPDVLNICAKEFRADLEARLTLGAPVLTYIHELHLTEGRAKLNLDSGWGAPEISADSEQREPPSGDPLQTFFKTVTTFREMKVDRIQIALRSLDVVSGATEVRGWLEVGANDNALAVNYSGSLIESGTKAKKRKVSPLEGSVNVAYDEKIHPKPWAVRAYAKGFGYQVNAGVDAALTGDRVSADITGRAQGGDLAVDQALIRDCRLEWKGTPAKGHLETECPIVLALSARQLERRKKLSWDGRFQTVFRTDLQLLQEQVQGKISLNLEPLKTKVFAAKAGVSFEIDGARSQLSRFYQLPSQLQGTVDIPEFQRVVELLDGTRLAVPGPFNALQGRVAADVSGGGQFLVGESKYPFDLNTKLKSQKQILDLLAKGAFNFRSEKSRLQTHLDLGLELSDVMLALPPIDVTRPTRFIPDPRIEYTQELMSHQPSSFSYAVHLTTPKPARLVSNLSDQQIPVTLDLWLKSDSEMQGRVTVASFPANLFRRRAVLDHFSIFMDPRNGASPRLDGRLKVAYADYTVMVMVKGTLAEPRMVLDSDPPLSEDDVVSVLLYGRPVSELTSNEGDTAANARAALAKRSMSLASMYLLASTPIESVGFDPITGAVQAKIRIDDQTSVTLQSDTKGGHQALGVRRRIGSWSIQTYIEDSESVQSEKTVSAFLEWSKRY